MQFPIQEFKNKGAELVAEAEQYLREFLAWLVRVVLKWIKEEVEPLKQEFKQVLTEIDNIYTKYYYWVCVLLAIWILSNLKFRFKEFLLAGAILIVMKWELLWELLPPIE